MPAVGDFKDPFPFTPYAVQHDAVTRLRRFLLDNVNAIAVLESPTGTGKSHMLLASVLSDLFTPVYASPGSEDKETEGGNLHDDAKRDAETVTNASLTAPDGITSLESARRKQLFEEEVARMKDERRARVKQLRRRMREARKRKVIFTQSSQLSGSSTGAVSGAVTAPLGKRSRETMEHSDDGEFLVDQNLTDFLDEPIGDVSPVFSFTSSSSSSSHASSRSEGSDSDDDNANAKDQEASVLSQLASLVPLRKPKAYFASRTHTQIGQLFDDLLVTDFARRPVLSKPRATKDKEKGNKAGDGPTAVPRALKAVHVGGRQQLCINAAIRKAAGGRSETLNELCLEAMKYESSKAGRAARKSENRQQSAGLFLRSASTTATAAATAMGNGPRGGEVLGDIEDTHRLKAAKGCAYCATSKIKALLTELQIRSEKRATDAGDSSDPPSSARSLPLSMDALKALGEQMKACPYLTSRLLVRGADVVFVPYGYLVDEDLRNGLLGGVATNPMNEAEAEEAREVAITGGNEEDSVSSPAHTSLASVLYHRRQMALAALGMHSAGQRQPQREKAEEAWNHAKRGSGWDDTLVEAAGRPPSFRGDVIVLDEAHNVAGYCQSVSSSQITVDELALVRGLLEGYLQRYESRLLSKNKQRIREMILFTGRIVTYCEQQLALPGVKLEEKEESTVVKSFSSFVFEAGIDHVDVFPFLIFLVDSRLSVKLQGLVPFVLAHEAKLAREIVEERQGKERLALLDRARGARAKDSQRHRIDLQNNALQANDGFSHHSPENEQQQQPRLAFTDLFQSLLNACGTPRLPSVSPQVQNIHTEGTSAATLRPFSTDEAVSAATRAMQSFETLLRSFYISDSGNRTQTNAGGNTRVLLSNKKPAHVGAPLSVLTIKIVQLEPGEHTLAPIIQEAKDVILAGGTMQPLPLSCGLLLPPPTALQQQSLKRAGGASVERSIALISEPHVVAPSAVSVWALPCGPSGRRLEFSQQALSGSGGGQDGKQRQPSFPSTAPTTTIPITAVAPREQQEVAIFTELATALLNFARVLPPAGVICFFTSYEMERKFCDFLVRRGFFDEINAVKRIFRESNSPQSVNSGSGALNGISSVGKREGVTRSDSSNVDEMLSEYKKWIEGSGESRNGEVKSSGQRRGALLFAVMGGKLSEGINFADDLGRAVIVVGLPYANLADAELRLFLRHVATTRFGPVNNMSTLDPPKSVSAAAAESFGCATAASLTREEWSLYTDMCMRTVNQCIGRCIRHLHDYAVVILLDARYAERGDVRRRVSTWMQPSMNVASNFGECFRGVRQFFAEKARELSCRSSE